MFFTNECKHVALVLILVVLALFQGSAGCLEDDDELKKADVPVWEAGYTWVYRDSEDDSLDVIFITGMEDFEGCSYYVGGKSRCELEGRFGGKGTDYFSMEFLSEIFLSSGKPVYRDYDFPLETGKSWENRDTYHEEYIGNFTVMGVEKITTEAGSFQCFNVTGHLVNEDDDGVQYRNRTFYYSPKVKREVKFHRTIEYRDHDNPNFDYSWNFTEELVTYGFGDRDGDLIADRVEEKIYGTDPVQADTDGDGVLDWQDIVPLEDIHLLVTIVELETQDNDEYENGANPTDCDPFFAVELWDRGSSEMFYSSQTEVVRDQNHVENIEILLDLPEEKDCDLYGFDTTMDIHLKAWDDDGQEETDVDGDDEVDISHLDSYDFCVTRHYFGVGQLTVNLFQTWELVDEGTELEDEGDGHVGTNGNIKGGRIVYTVQVVTEEL